MRKIFIVASVFAMLGCTKGVDESGLAPVEKARDFVVRAVSEDDKLVLGPLENGSREIQWSNEDQIALYDGTVEKLRYTVSTAQGSTATITSTDLKHGMRTLSPQKTIAVFPYSAVQGITGNSTVKITLSDTQVYAADNTYGKEANVMLAQSDYSSVEGATTALEFKNALSYLKITFNGGTTRSSFYLRRVILESNRGNIAGTYDLKMVDGIPQLSNEQNGSKTITIDFGEDGLQLNESRSFIFAVPAGTLTQGFKIIATALHGSQKVFTSMIKETTKSQTFTRNVVKSMPAFDYEPVYKGGTTVVVKEPDYQNPSTDIDIYYRSLVGNWDEWGRFDDDLGIVSEGKMPEWSINKLLATFWNGSTSRQSYNKLYWQVHHMARHATDDTKAIACNYDENTDPLIRDLGFDTTCECEIYVSFLCESAWNENTLGYYYYPKGQKPTTRPLVRYMVFPNASMPNHPPFQLESTCSKKFDPQYAPVHRNSRIELLYEIEDTNHEYPENVTLYTLKFPAGMHVGFFFIGNGGAVDHSSSANRGKLNWNSDRFFSDCEWDIYKNVDRQSKFCQRFLSLTEFSTKGSLLIYGVEDSTDCSFDDLVFCVQATPASGIKEDTKSRAMYCQSGETSQRCGWVQMPQTDKGKYIIFNPGNYGPLPGEDTSYNSSAR